MWEVFDFILLRIVARMHANRMQLSKTFHWFIWILVAQLKLRYFKDFYASLSNVALSSKKSSTNGKYVIYFTCRMPHTVQFQLSCKWNINGKLYDDLLQSLSMQTKNTKNVKFKNQKGEHTNFDLLIDFVRLCAHILCLQFGVSKWCMKFETLEFHWLVIGMSDERDEKVLSLLDR